MSHVQIFVHAHWATKSPSLLLTPVIKKSILRHIRFNAKEKGIKIDRIIWDNDVVRCIVALGPSQSISKVMNYLKGESSRWANQNRKIKKKFTWRKKYLARSLSREQLQIAREQFDRLS